MKEELFPSAITIGDCNDYSSVVEDLSKRLHKAEKNCANVAKRAKTLRKSRKRSKA
jgi:hypothetical protein